MNTATLVYDFLFLNSQKHQKAELDRDRVRENTATLVYDFLLINSQKRQKAELERERVRENKGK